MKPLRYPLPALCTGLLVALSGYCRSAEAQMSLVPRWTTETASQNNPLPIEQENLNITISNQHATTVLSQQYVNNSQQVLEGVCTLRAGQNTKVSGFAYWNGTTKIRGEVFEKEAAAQVYAETTGLRRDPGLVEQTGEGSFSFRVFPIQPMEHKRVELTLTQRLPREGSRVEYRVPLANPAAQIRVTLEDTRPLDGLASETHHLEIVPSNGKMVVTATPQTKQEKEFVLTYEVKEEPYTVSVVTHQDPGQPAYLAISLATLPTVVRSNKDVTIVLDHSGSMSGAPMNEARSAAKEIVTRLTKHDRINVIAFDDHVQTLFNKMEPVTDDNRNKALRFLDNVTEGGGTEIGLALEEALKHQRTNAERPIVMLLTDGESDAAKVFSVAEQDKSKARVFTVGLGSGVNRPLLSRLSDMKRGRFTYIQSADAIRPEVSRLFAHLENAALRAPELMMENGQLLEMQPSTLPDLAPGEELLVTARAVGNGPAKITLKGTTNRGLIQSSTTVQLDRASVNPWVGRLWAQERTNRVLEDISLKGETEERKNLAIELAVAYGFVTPYTSFLAIPESELTDSTSQLMSDMRAKKKAILAKRADAVALSRSEMPPGDPVLTVDAPSDAQRVTAYFPFGLTKELTYDARALRWRVRFLVPNSVKDGTYTVPVVVVKRDGQLEFLSGSYTIDSREPEFEVTTQCDSGKYVLEVRTQQPMREVWAALVSDPRKRTQLTFVATENGLAVYRALLKVNESDGKVRVVVTDMARNEAEEIVTCAGTTP